MRGLLGRMSVCCTLLALLTTVAAATTVRRMSFDVVLDESLYVIYGRALGDRSFYEPVSRMIWTQTEFLVMDGPKGRPGRTVLVTEPGGIVGDIGHLVPGAPRFDPNREYVLFLYRAPGDYLRVVGLQQGVYLVSPDRQTGEKLVQPAVEPPETVHESGKAHAASGSRTSGPRRLSEFLFAIRQTVERR